MIRVGLTGNIGTGKSTVARILENFGVPVFHADEEAKKLYDQPAVRKEVEELFGPGIYSGQEVNREALGRIVFSDKTRLDQLNAIIHPRVRERLNEWFHLHRDQPYAVQEAAILFETGFYKYFDKNILVVCPEDVAIQRVIARDGVTAGSVRERLKNQWPEEKKRPLADYIITNDGISMVLPQVLSMHEKLMVEGRSGKPE